MYAVTLRRRILRRSGRWRACLLRSRQPDAEERELAHVMRHARGFCLQSATRAQRQSARYARVQSCTHEAASRTTHSRPFRRSA
eukprot:3957909-Pleurochrysis_carterae.AAC.1